MRILGVIMSALVAVGLPAVATAADRVLTAEYTLGDTAFQVPGFHDGDGERLADIELTATVHYPRNVASGTHPLVLLMHGYWQTCADRRAPEADHWRWPCAEGTPAMPSHRGYDYLARQIAGHGYVVVSVSANGVNAGEAGDPADAARAALINKHLAMWQELSTKGTGPLAGKLTADFTGHVDLNNVGTMGHSRAGRAVMLHASDMHRDKWPAGVTVRAVIPLAAAGYYAPDPEAPENDAFRVTRTPFASFIGTCDATSNPGARDYFTNSAGRNQVPISQLTLRGANHNYFNTQWSPSSGQDFAHDDAEPAPLPGHCRATHGDQVERQLTEQWQRMLATTYVSAFFRRHLSGETRFDPLLTGRLPVPGVEVEYRP